VSTPIGIDLGTTNSAVACRDAYGRPSVVSGREGGGLLPSVIYFGVGPPAVGAEAREYARLGDDQVASFFKPHMGNPLYRLRFGAKDYDATDLSALVLARLKGDAEAFLKAPVRDAVVTVPAYFADAQRTATIEAARRAGLHVLGILNEPTAAALAYGLQHPEADESVLIYDLGGGTFDVTVARITPDEVAVLATSGDHDLGGKNWDDRIATDLAGRFEADTGVDPLDDPANLTELLLLAERAKWALSERTATRVTVQIGGERRGYELSRADFEAMSFPLMDRTRRLTEESLAESGLTWRELTGVILVGGSTRMPMVRQYVTQMSGQPPRGGVNVDEAVALGAAIRAWQLAGGSGSIGAAVPSFTLPGARRVRDVMSHSLGVVAVAPDGNSYVNDIIIRRNLPIPAESTKCYLHETHGGRNDRLEIYLTQGESARPLDGSILGKYGFTGIQATAAEVVIDVHLSYDANGVVKVRAEQRDTLRELAMAVEPVPDDLSWLDGPPAPVTVESPVEPVRVVLLLDVSASMTGPPLEEARAASLEFLEKCDFTRMEVGLIAFSNKVSVLCEPTDNARKVQAALGRLETDSTTNLTDALAVAAGHLAASDRSRFLVLLTDGFPDAPESAVDEADKAKARGIEIVAIGTGEADRDYLTRIASTEAGSIFAKRTELVTTFGHIARVLAGGGMGLRKLT
jgi:molecular chaperone DnaK (HSP70)